jgi:antitoxin HicB
VHGCIGRKGGQIGGKRQLKTMTKAMKRAKINKVEMARRMHTSRAALHRLLDPGNASVTLQTLFRAARAIGRDLRIELV